MLQKNGVRKYPGPEAFLWRAKQSVWLAGSGDVTVCVKLCADPSDQTSRPSSWDSKDGSITRHERCHQFQGWALATTGGLNTCHFFLSWNRKLKITTKVALSTAARTAVVIKLNLQMEHVSNLLYFTYPKFQTHWSSCITGLTHNNFSLEDFTRSPQCLNILWFILFGLLCKVKKYVINETLFLTFLQTSKNIEVSSYLQCCQ